MNKNQLTYQYYKNKNLFKFSLLFKHSLFFKHRDTVLSLSITNRNKVGIENPTALMYSNYLIVLYDILIGILEEKPIKLV